MRWCLLFLIIFKCSTPLDAWPNPLAAIYRYLPCLTECCSDEFVLQPNFYKLQNDLLNQVFGQSMIIERLIPALKSHYFNEPKKPLVISMNGWTGGGKNYVTKIVTDNLYKLGSKSGYVHHFNGRLHFPRESAVNEYQVNLQEWIQGNVSACSRSMFIFDEVDKMPPGVIDAISPFLDYHDEIAGVNFRQAIFVFISNIGGSVITRKYLELWENGISRENMHYRDFEPILRDALYMSNGGFRLSGTLEAHLVSLYLPFFPLEKEHLERCIEIEFKRQGIWGDRTKEARSILEEMEYYKDRFSTSGCKRVGDRVAVFIYGIHEDL